MAADISPVNAPSFSVERFCPPHKIGVCANKFCVSAKYTKGGKTAHSTVFTAAVLLINCCNSCWTLALEPCIFQLPAINFFRMLLYSPSAMFVLVLILQRY